MLDLGPSSPILTNGGDLAVEGVVNPTEKIRFGYVLAGPTPSELADPTVEVTASETQSGEIQAEWVAEDGGVETLAVVTDRLPGTDEKALHHLVAEQLGDHAAVAQDRVL